MPRSARIILENSCYHIIARGNQKQEVFFDVSDHEKYLQLLKKYKNKYSFKLYGYCLMSNHIHMIMDPKGPYELSKAVHGISLSYSIWFNAKYEKVGHLWQDRYIEANPVRAKIVNNPLHYPWSSYKERIFDVKNGLLDSPDFL
jgi:putative transposase